MPRYNTVIFDCDSTLSALEGIDELACDHRAEVARLTEAAMEGAIPLEEVYGARLQLVRPTRAALAALGERYVEELVPDARGVVAALRGAGVLVRIISGGLLPAVAELAGALGVPREDLAAVDIRFDARGDYAGFDSGSPLARGGGKREVIAGWAPELRRPVMLVGDGATDLEAASAVDAFVAFAGVMARPAVVGAADAVITARSLAPVLALALGDDPPLDPEGRALYGRGARMLERSAARSPRAGRAAAPRDSTT